MIRLEKEGLYVRINTRDFGFLALVKEHFSGYAEGYQFHPKYLSGVWDGRVYLLKERRLLPYGVLPDLLKLHREQYSHVPLEIDPRVKSFYATNDVSSAKLEGYVWDLAEHQVDAVLAGLKYQCGIIRSCTGSGKSLIMHVILDNLFQQEKIKKALVIVPNTMLVTQLYTNFVDEYGADPTRVGKVYSKMKEWDKEIVISTWQSLMNNHDKLLDFDCVFVDEVQGAKSYQIAKILETVQYAKIRMGFTGTLPDAEYDKWCIKSFLGPVLFTVDVATLQENGWLSQCLINRIQIFYNNFKKQFKSNVKSDMTAIQAANLINSEVFKSPFRLWVLKKYLDRIEKGAALLLVGKVDTEGKFLKEYLEQYYPDRDIVFVSGGTKEKEREEWRQRCKDPNCKIILIATYPIFQAGVDIPALAHIFFVAPYKSKIRILQSIGRGLRKHDSKEKGAFIYDLVDMDDGFNERNSDMRMNFYDREDFEVAVINEKEGT